VNAAGRDQTVITGGDHLVVNVGGPGAAEPAVPGLLPRDVPAFTGREAELTRLAGLADGKRVVVTAIDGTAGVGKTALAVHAAHQLLKQFPDGHLYADLRGYTEGQHPAEPGEVLELFLRHLGVRADEVPAAVEERSGLLRQRLASRRVLMVLDNARTEAQVRPLLPGAGGSLVLVTSRSVLPGLEVNQRINLDVLPAEEAAAMLAGAIGMVRAAAEPEAVAELARLCGRLPLALRIAGQQLAAHPPWPTTRLVEMLANEQDRLDRLGVGDLQVRAAFEVSYAQLPDQDKRLFRLLGLHPGADFNTEAAAVLAGTNLADTSGILNRLVEAHLVTEDASGRFRMHDLLRLYAHSTCQQADDPADRNAAEGRLVSYYVTLARFLNGCVDPRERPAAARVAEQAIVPLPSMRKAMAIFHAERPCMLAVLGLAARRGWDKQIELLSLSMENPLSVLRYLDDLLTVTETALISARHAGDPHVEATALNNLGEAYRESRRFLEAITCYEQVIAISRETGDRYGECQALSNLGTAYQELQRFEEAIPYLQQALAGLRETGHRAAEGQTLNNLGNTYQALRRFEEAIDCFQQDIAICQEISDGYGEGQTLNNLGTAHQQLRRFEEAITYYQQALVRRRETGDRYGEGRTLCNLGVAYYELRQPDRAAACWLEGATAMQDVGDHEEARLLKQMATNTQTEPRRRWWSLRHKSSS
jgi:tetratricopeptide (TPR) repeat protein